MQQQVQAEQVLRILAGITILALLKSLGLMSLGAATDGVTPIFLKNDNFFSHRHLQSDDLCSSVVSSLVVTPTFRPPLSSVFLNSATFFISFGCHRLEGVTRGVRPRLPSDATILTPTLTLTLTLT